MAILPSTSPPPMVHAMAQRGLRSATVEPAVAQCRRQRVDDRRLIVDDEHATTALRFRCTAQLYSNKCARHTPHAARERPATCATATVGVRTKISRSRARKRAGIHLAVSFADHHHGQSPMWHARKRALPVNKNLTALGVVAGLGIGGLIGVTAFSPGASNAQSATASTATAAPGARAKTAEEQANEARGTWGFDRARDTREAADGNRAALLARAKITPAQAAAAAVAVAPGVAGSPDIHDRDGTLTYRVEVATATGVVEVRVDATTGTAAVDNDANNHHFQRGHETGPVPGT